MSRQWADTNCFSCHKPFKPGDLRCVAWHKATGLFPTSRGGGANEVTICVACYTRVRKESFATRPSDRYGC